MVVVIEINHFIKEKKCAQYPRVKLYVPRYVFTYFDA